ncbi:tetratricopeptide repeat protein [Chelatococcus reniformis]|uniref:Tetratricopeptide repeat protein n=1 Tax=Chelatococcus reniformis TaxID=1494448 RepID=A0A916UPI2_9HYPH|nr:tetratricopeptide repeat protein [Chelatococcus reniformis]GGC80731.1 hypothetical protein GCM10010994_43410 [Chelatococcus reniformis]
MSRTLHGMYRRAPGWRATAVWPAALALALAGGTALAAGGGGGGGGGDAETCPRGEVYSAGARQCVKARAGVMSDDALADYAYVLAKKAERYDEALEVLALVKDQNTPKVLNYRGYATRKLGRVDEGIGYYLKSVALDPRYAQVREYLGEAYVSQGKIDLAREQLAAIEAIGGRDSEEYEDLAAALAAAEAKAVGAPAKL